MSWIKSEGHIKSTWPLINGSLRRLKTITRRMVSMERSHKWPITNTLLYISPLLAFYLTNTVLPMSCTTHVHLSINLHILFNFPYHFSSPSSLLLSQLSPLSICFHYSPPILLRSSPHHHFLRPLTPTTMPRLSTLDMHETITFIIVLLESVIKIIRWILSAISEG